MPIPTDLIPLKCSNCGKKIGEVKMKDGIVAIVCSKCGVLNIQEAKPDKSSQTANNG